MLRACATALVLASAAAAPLPGKKAVGDKKEARIRGK